MPALNFKADWAKAVEFGAILANGNMSVLRPYLPKRTTIRKPGRAKPGDTLYLYTGQRTKTCRKLGEALCLAVTPVRIAKERIHDAPYMYLDGQIISGVTLDRFACLDTAGFWRTDQFMAFFADIYGLPFDGELICW